MLMRLSDMLDDGLDWVRLRFAGPNQAIIQTISVPIAFSVFFSDRHTGPWVCYVLGLDGAGLLVYYGVVGLAWMAFAWDLNR